MLADVPDMLYDLHEVAKDIAGFVWKMTTYPDLICVLGMQESQFLRRWIKFLFSSQTTNSSAMT